MAYPRTWICSHVHTETFEASFSVFKTKSREKKNPKTKSYFMKKHFILGHRFFFLNVKIFKKKKKQFFIMIFFKDCFRYEKSKEKFYVLLFLPAPYSPPPPRFRCFTFWFSVCNARQKRVPIFFVWLLEKKYLNWNQSNKEPFRNSVTFTDGMKERGRERSKIKQNTHTQNNHRKKRSKREREGERDTATHSKVRHSPQSRDKGSPPNLGDWGEIPPPPLPVWVDEGGQFCKLTVLKFNLGNNYSVVSGLICV